MVEEVRSFLRQTSVLEQLSPALCEAVTGQKNSRQMLDQLERSNLFLVPLDENCTWYRYHALFAELLRNQLLQLEPDRLDELNARAADWYQKHGFIQQAVEHAFQISDCSPVSQLIETYAIPMLYQGEVSTVAAWFERLPEELLASAPMMWISKAWSLALMQRTGRADEVYRALERADQALDAVNADADLRNLVAGHATSVQAMLLQAPA